MTNATNSNGGAPNVTPEPPKKKRRFRFVMLAGLAAAVGLGGYAFGHATGHAQGAWGGGFGEVMGGHGHGWKHKAHFGGRWFGRGGMTEERATRRAVRMARHLSAAVDATPEQTEAMKTLARDLVKDVFPLRADMKTARQQATDILTAPNVDRTKLESLRAEQMAKADEATQRITKALADASEVLNEKQRADLADRVAQFRDMRSWWHRGKDRTED